MKRIKYFILLIVLFSSTSCEKMLEKNPNDFLYDTNKLYSTEKGLESAIAAVYDRLAAIYNNAWHYTMGIEADEGYFARAGYVNPGIYNFPASESSILYMWRTMYEGVERANVFLKNVDTNKEIPEQYRDIRRGEALFLRGYFYFMLVQSFGGVPIRTEPTEDATDNMEKARNTVAEVYAQVLADMEKAETLVPEITVYNHGGRISKSAVRGILARVNLTMAGYPLRDETRYSEVLRWANLVKTSGLHSLNPDYTNIFVKYARDQYDPKESIWEVEFWGNRTDVFTETGTLGFSNGPQNSNPLTGNGFSGVKPTPYYFRKFHELDIRRDWTIAPFSYTNAGPNGSKTVIITTSDANIYNRNVGKWRREFETLTPKTNGVTPQNFPLLRYSDILLMIAEAETEFYKDPTPEAFNCINEVRRRGFGQGYRLKALTRTSQGSGYTAVPWILIKPKAGHEGAVAYAHTTLASAGVNTTFTIMGRGAFYEATPPVVEVISTNGVGSGGAISATTELIDPTVANLPNTLDYTDFMNELRDERSREFGFEGMRKFDLIRWGIFNKVMGDVYNQVLGIPSSNLNNEITNRFFNARFQKHLLWPIPSAELLVNRNMVQNPGW